MESHWHSHHTSKDSPPITMPINGKQHMLYCMDCFVHSILGMGIREYMEKYPDKQGVLFVLDVDNFKKINDTMGHAFGDEVLRSLAVRLQSMFRATDIVGRTGGDEFMVFLKDIREISMIEREGRKIEQFFHQFEVGEYVKYSVTASVGAAVFPGDGKSFEELYKAADNALYVSKRHGKNQLSFYKKPENETK